MKHVLDCPGRGLSLEWVSLFERGQHICRGYDLEIDCDC